MGCDTSHGKTRIWSDYNFNVLSSVVDYFSLSLYDTSS